MLQTIQNLNEDTFKEVIGSSEKTVLVDFWAPWCGPCRAIAPVLEQVAESQSGKAVIAKVNVDEQPGIANRFNVRSIPNLIVFKGGKPVRQLIGFQNRDAIESALA